MVIAGCAASTAPVQLAVVPDPAGPPPPQIFVPAVIPSDGVGIIRIIDPGADSIALESLNGIDRLGVRRGTMTARIRGNFGEARDTARYASWQRGYLFDVLKRPIKITTCRQRQCRSYYHTLAIKLPEQNRHQVALTGGWATSFTQRAITGQNKTVLLREALNNSLWSLQAEVATHGFNARLHGYYNSGEQGASIDLSRTFKPASSDVMGYGLAMHVAARNVDWFEGNLGSVSDRGRAWQASAGPSFMLKGLTASSQLGLYSDGMQTLQLVSTFVSLNGNLTDVRTPVSVTLEKTFAFGGDPLVSRRREGTDRMTVGIQLAPNLALRLGTSARHSAWPIEGSTGNIRISETYYSIGAQYTLTW